MSVLKDARFAWSIASGKPFQVLVQVTNRCNMRCSFCDFWPNGVPPAEELTLDDYRRIARELSSVGSFLVSVEGGEPTLRPDLVEIVRAFAEWHHPVLYTNGWHVSETLARDLFAAGLTQVGVSIDFSDPIRHDAKRGLAGAWDRAWRAVETLRSAAPKGGRQVHVMTVYMADNRNDFGRLLERSRDAGVGHQLTLLSKNGYRRGDGVDDWPGSGVSAELRELQSRFPHFRVFSRYLDGIDPFLAYHSRGGALPVAPALPRCEAGARSFNIDHVGNVSPCIEKIDRPVGNVRRESTSEPEASESGGSPPGGRRPTKGGSLAEILPKLAKLEEVASCQQCWTLCRGFNQVFAGGGTLGSWRELATRVRA